tara:strand:- start:155 stop:1000 length:846 start_codon:yes stop_codon:yes gene_type:complete
MKKVKHSKKRKNLSKRKKYKRKSQNRKTSGKNIYRRSYLKKRMRGGASIVGTGMVEEIDEDMNSSIFTKFKKLDDPKYLNDTTCCIRVDNPDNPSNPSYQKMEINIFPKDSNIIVNAENNEKFLYVVLPNNPYHLYFIKDDQSRELYNCSSKEKTYLHHNCLANQFVSNASIIAGGEIKVFPTEKIIYVDNQSGHYRPDERSLEVVKTIFYNWNLSGNNIDGYKILFPFGTPDPRLKRSIIIHWDLVFMIDSDVNEGLPTILHGRTSKQEMGKLEKLYLSI